MKLACVLASLASGGRRSRLDTEETADGRRPEHAEGLRRHAEAGVQEADHAAVPGVQAARLPALPRAAPPEATRERPREMRRLLALRGRLPCGLHPRRAGGEHARQPRIGGRALRAHLRDQHVALHLLRLLRARVPVRRDRARERVRDLRVQPRRPDLHEGHAARAADQARACPGPGSLRHADPVLQGPLVILASAGNVLVWIVWVAAAFSCLASGVAVISFTNPFYSALALIGNLASLAVLFLLLSGEFVAAGQVLVYGGAVMVMFLFVIAYLGDKSEDSPWSGGPSWQVVGAVLAGGAILAEVIVVVGLKAGDFLSQPKHVDRAFGSPAALGRLFLTDHLLAFEVTSIVLLVAAVGGVVLGSHARQVEGDARA